MGEIMHLSLVEGSYVSYQGVNYEIKRVLDFTSVLLKSLEKNDNQIVRAEIKKLSVPIHKKTESDSVQKDVELMLIPEKKWEIAQKRFELINSIILNNPTTEEIKRVAKENDIHFSTLYRWLNRYKRTESLSSLVPTEKSGGKGKARLSPEIEAVIMASIEDEYLTKQKKSIQKVYETVAVRCRNANITPPSSNTVRRRVEALSEEFKMHHRYGREVTRNIFEPLKKKYDDAKYPLQIVQIDHTSLDIILVDEVYRKPLQRPWITLAFDIYSRMVMGFYISFDPPGALGTGMCLAHAILPKEMWLAKYDILEEWPCWGVMGTIHADNAKEFRGSMLKRSAEEYGINLEWREVKRPNWGGHIERYLGTLLKEIHALPGTTFSNIKERKTYNSAAQSALTLSELEKWLTAYITGVYHKRFHTGIKTSPIAKYNEGVFGSGQQKGIGIPKRIFNERKVKLDFLPYVERTVQEYGVQIEHIHYYDDKLRPYINSIEPNQKKSKQRRKFIFKIDPRDISVIYFYDPELKQYFNIPYRDISHPPITIWEYREVERWLLEKGRSNIDEKAIFEGYERMKEIESKAQTQTRKVRHIKKASKRKHSMEKSLKTEFKAEPDSNSDNTEATITTKPMVVSNFKPYEEIDI